MKMIQRLSSASEKNLVLVAMEKVIFGVDACRREGRAGFSSCPAFEVFERGGRAKSPALSSAGQVGGHRKPHRLGLAPQKPGPRDWLLHRLT